jgi:hypothetical protein
MLTREGSGLWFVDSVRDFDVPRKFDTMLKPSIPENVAVEYEWDDKVRLYGKSRLRRFTVLEMEI